MRYGLLSTHPPTRCGLATFNAALAGSLVATGAAAGVVRVVEPGDNPRGSAAMHTPSADVLVVHTWAGREADGWRSAADALNTFDVAIIQHEYGIYPADAGGEVLPLLQALHVPSIVVLHTVLSTPDPLQRRVLERIAATADAVVTMTDTARQRLLNGYAVDPRKITVIPHGVGSHVG